MYLLCKQQHQPLELSKLKKEKLLSLCKFINNAAWHDNLKLTIVGFNSNVVIVNNTYTLQIFLVSLLTFIGYTGLDPIKFTTFGPTLSLT
jgi:hypothetical protein